MHQLIVENPWKKCQRKWVRFGRKHSMSLWQGDWKHLVMNETDTWVIAFIDDSSRLFTCYGVFESPTTENTIAVLTRRFREYGIPLVILSDHGTQFVSARDREHAQHTFKGFLDQLGIKHIVAQINTPRPTEKSNVSTGGLNEELLSPVLSIRSFIDSM